MSTRTIVSLPPEQRAALEVLCARERISMAEAIRRALDRYLDAQASEADDAFGLWRERAVDAMHYLDELRNGW